MLFHFLHTDTVPPQRILHLQHCPNDGKSWWGLPYMHNYKNRTNSNKYAAGLPLDITVAFQEDHGLFCLAHYFLHLTKRKEVIWGKEDDNITTVNAELKQMRSSKGGLLSRYLDCKTQNQSEDLYYILLDWGVFLGYKML